MSEFGAALISQFDAEDLDRLRALLAVAEVEQPMAPKPTSPWLTAAEAASRMRCPLSRVRKLTMTRELPHERDGRRVLYHRGAVDDFIRCGGAKSP
jgi:excisionase family DNA binding protein